MRSPGRRMMRAARIASGALLVVTVGLLPALPASAGAKAKVLKPVTYADTTTYSCRTDALDIHPGQNLNLFRTTKTCPNARVVSGPGSLNVFSPGSDAKGYVTKFKPSM